VAESSRPETVDVLVVGGGPSGLAAASACRELGIGNVLLVEREVEAGGIARHSHHTGYGLRDLRRMMAGPAYAQAWRSRAIESGVDVRTECTVTELDVDDGPRRVWVTAPTGRRAIDAGAVVLATGCRERPRSARLIPGDRAAGVYTTGTLQQLAHVEHIRPGTRAVVVGAEHVSYSAVVTLEQAGCDVVAMVTEQPRATTFGAFHRAAGVRWRFPLHTDSSVTQISGRPRVTSVDVTGRSTGRTTTIACDTVVLTGDWVADHELATRAGVAMNAAATGPRVDTAQRTSAPGVFAIGNLTHPAETADVCALDGRAVAGGVQSWLDGGWWPSDGVDVIVFDPLTWVSPSFVTDATTPPRGRLVLRANAFRRAPRVQVTQADRMLWSGRVPWLVPTRPAYVPTPWLRDLDRAPGGAPVWITVR